MLKLSDMDSNQTNGEIQNMAKKEKQKEKPEGYVFGRPTIYKPEFCQMLIDHMAEGYSFESFAGKVNTTFKTLYNWEQEHLEFLQAKLEGKAKCLIKWEEIGVKGIVSITESTRNGNNMETFSKALNSAVYRLNMANRFGWKENKVVEEKKTEKRLIIKSKKDDSKPTDE